MRLGRCAPPHTLSHRLRASPSGLVSTDLLVQEINKQTLIRKTSSFILVKEAEQALVRDMQLSEFSHVRGLGNGAFGQVYLVRHIRPNGETGGAYALKPVCSPD